MYYIYITDVLHMWHSLRPAVRNKLQCLQVVVYKRELFMDIMMSHTMSMAGNMGDNV